MIAALIILANLWTWTGSSEADGYEFCWTRDLSYWSQGTCIRVADTFFDTAEVDPVWAVEQTPGAILFYQFRAYNAAGYDVEGPEYHPAPALWVCP